MNNFTQEYNRQFIETLAKLLGCNEGDIAEDNKLLTCLQTAPAEDINMKLPSVIAICHERVYFACFPFKETFLNLMCSQQYMYVFNVKRNSLQLAVVRIHTAVIGKYCHVFVSQFLVQNVSKNWVRQRSTLLCDHRNMYLWTKRRPFKF